MFSSFEYSVASPSNSLANNSPNPSRADIFRSSNVIPAGTSASVSLSLFEISSDKSSSPVILFKSVFKSTGSSGNIPSVVLSVCTSVDAASVLGLSVDATSVVSLVDKLLYSVA